MSDETIRQTFQQLFDTDLIDRNFTVVWHAGEPMVLPPAYYQNAIGIIDSLTPGSVTVDHSIQTNGTLITQQWCDLITRHNIKIGLSIDGPSLLHNLYRKTRRGGNTHEAAMTGAQLLQRNGIAFHIIMVLTRQALEYPDEIFDFFIDNEIDQIAFNIEEIEGINRTSTLEEPNVDEQFRRFLRRFIQLSKDCESDLWIREIVDSLTAIKNFSDRECHNQQTTPYQILSVDCEGNISTFSPELLGMENKRYGNFIYANVFEKDAFRSILHNAEFRKANSDIQKGVQLCKENCEYFSLCKGGAPSNKLYERGSFATSETLYCRLMKKSVIDVVLSELESDLGLRDVLPPSPSQSG